MSIEKSMAVMGLASEDVVVIKSEGSIAKEQVNEENDKLSSILILILIGNL